jgi:choline dehydrogenase-like flavoprotein
MRRLPYLARCVVLRRDAALGSIDAEGTIDYPLLAADWDALRRGLLAATELYLAAGAVEVWLPLQRPHSIRDLADAEALLPRALDPSRLASLYAVHLFGGARMGDVCDEDGAVRGVKGLYVADASSLPGNTGVNPQITVLANAQRIAEGIAA